MGWGLLLAETGGPGGSHQGRGSRTRELCQNLARAEGAEPENLARTRLQLVFLRLSGPGGTLISFICLFFLPFAGSFQCVLKSKPEFPASPESRAQFSGALRGPGEGGAAPGEECVSWGCWPHTTGASPLSALKAASPKSGCGRRGSLCRLCGSICSRPLCNCGELAALGVPSCGVLAALRVPWLVDA